MIRPEENEIRCDWKLEDGRIVGSPECDRINTLVKSFLRKIASDASGWNKLYQDPSDGRFWELTYPSSHMHGGGPPLLVCISESDAHKRYNF